MSRGSALRATGAGEDPELDLREARGAPTSPATRRSHASASSNPPPSAKPSIAAITGRGIASSASNAARNAALIARRDAVLGELGHVGAGRERLLAAR